MVEPNDGTGEAVGGRAPQPSCGEKSGGKSRPMFSIVMPAYNVQDYISDAIESVLAQTIDDWELIVVDDASPDASGEIARRFAEQDRRIRVVCHNENRWLGEARNTGMDVACGRYIWFLDADDRCLPNLLERCTEVLTAHPADAVMFGHVERYIDSDGNLTAERQVSPDDAVLATKEALRERILDYEKLTCYGYSWNKIYDHDRIRRIGLRFGSTVFIEDILFNIAFFQDAESLNVISDPLYLYGKKEGGNITNSFKSDYYELHHRRIEALYDQQAAWGLLDDGVRSTLGSLLGRYVLSALERNCDPRSNMSGNDRRRWCEETFADPMFQDLVPYAEADDSRILDICLKPLRKGDVGGALRLGRLIHFARRHLSGVYRKLRSQR